MLNHFIYIFKLTHLLLIKLFLCQLLFEVHNLRHNYLLPTIKMRPLTLHIELILSRSCL